LRRDPASQLQRYDDRDTPQNGTAHVDERPRGRRAQKISLGRDSGELILFPRSRPFGQRRRQDPSQGSLEQDGCLDGPVQLAKRVGRP
jgi:hypothetical protein